MCGIVGFVDNRKTKEKKEIIKKMADRIIHRGPDAEGYYTDAIVALGHRRLSILDLSKSGAQPMYNEDKSLAVVFNGEIYNYESIREELKQKGHIFKTKTDTEVILHGYEEFKEKLFSQLRGMFSFVIYNKNTSELVGVRDHFGIKPFYYYKKDKTLLFGSEIKSFLEHPDFSKVVNTNALKMFLIFQYSVHEETFFKDVYKLKPGHYFKYKNGKMIIKEYFHVDYVKSDKPYDVYKKELTSILEDSIKYHQTTSDVEVGSYLSGGVDSSYVVSVAKPDKTFSVGFDMPGFDETGLAHDLSKKLNIKNFQKKITSDEFFKILPTIMYHTDEPHANLSTVPLYFLSGLAHEQVKVVLSGEGSDEMFAGYNEYYEPLSLRLYTKLPLGLRKIIAKFVNPLPHFPGQNTLKLYGKPFYERYIGHGSYMSEEEANDILAPDLRNKETIVDVIKPYYENVKDCDEITKKMYIDMHFWLPQDILLKADKMTMANSIELRVPLLDSVLYSYAKQIPTKYFVRNKETKSIFRDIAKEKIPEEWSKRRKLGFPVPFSKWIKEEKYYFMVKEKFESEYASLFFDKEYICDLLYNHYHNINNNGRKIYNIYVFLVWYDIYFNKN